MLKCGDFDSYIFLSMLWFPIVTTQREGVLEDKRFHFFILNEMHEETGGLC